MSVTANRVRTFSGSCFSSERCGLARKRHGSGFSAAARAASANPAAVARDDTNCAGRPTGRDAFAENATVSADEVEFCGLPVCSPPGRFWLRGEYLMWWTSGMDLPPLVTTSPQGTPQNQAGVLGQSGTTILFGGQTVNGDGRSGCPHDDRHMARLLPRLGLGV